MKNLFGKALAMGLAALVGCASPRTFMSQYNRNLEGHWLTESTYQRLMDFKVSEFSDPGYSDESGRPIPLIPFDEASYKGRLEKAVLFYSDPNNDKFVNLEELEQGIAEFKKRLVQDLIQIRRLKIK